jgi:hypothetical protein
MRRYSGTFGRNGRIPAADHSLTVFAAGSSLLISGAALRVRVVAGIRNDVAAPIAGFVRLEVAERLRSAPW